MRYETLFIMYSYHLVKKLVKLKSGSFLWVLYHLRFLILTSIVAVRPSDPTTPKHGSGPADVSGHLDQDRRTQSFDLLNTALSTSSPRSRSFSPTRFSRPRFSAPTNVFQIHLILTHPSSLHLAHQFFFRVFPLQYTRYRNIHFFTPIPLPLHWLPRRKS